jgi:hypothetical protein
MQAMKSGSGDFTASLILAGLFVIAAACLVPFMVEHAPKAVATEPEIEA